MAVNLSLYACNILVHISLNMQMMYMHNLVCICVSNLHTFTVCVCVLNMHCIHVAVFQVRFAFASASDKADD